MIVIVKLKETSQAIIYDDVENAYTKGPFYCIYHDGITHKYPIDSIWRVEESYGR